MQIPADDPRDSYSRASATAGRKSVDPREPAEEVGGFAGRLYGYWFYLVFVSSFLLLYPLFRYQLAAPRRYGAANDLRRFWARLIFFFMGCPWDVRFEEENLTESPVIYVSNHSSNLDIPMSALASKGNIRFLAKKQWAEVPVFGIFFRTVDMWVDRSSVTSSYRAFQEAAEALRAGMSLIIYPEGTMWANGAGTTAFKIGAFRMAIEEGIPVVPVTFVDNWCVYPRGGRMGGRPGRLRAVVHASISTEGMDVSQAADLRDQVRGIIDAELAAAHPPSLQPFQA